MLKGLLFLIPLLYPVYAFAQAAHSPQELANQVQALLTTNHAENIARYLYPDADPTSIERFKSDFATYVGAENLKVFVIPKDDSKAFEQYKATSSMPDAVKPLEERIKFYAEKGRFFPLEPLGDLVISGKRVGVNSAGSITSVVYSKHNSEYVIIFAKRKDLPATP